MHAVTTRPSLQVDYHQMLAGSPDTVVLLDVDSGKLVDVNANASELFGRTEEVLLSIKLVDLCPRTQPDGQLSSELLAACIQSIADGIIRSFKVSFLHASGRLLACDMRMVRVPVPGRRLMHVRIIDVTQRNLDDMLRIGQGRLLEMVARGAPLRETLDSLMLLIESQSEGVLCSVLLLDQDGITIHPASAPSLPPEYMALLDGFAIGPGAGSCGTAMFRKETVIVSDITTDPLWAPYKALVAPHGLRACWSTPIFLDKDHVLGSFAMYYREVRSPNAYDMRLISVATHLAGIAIERTRREHELAQHREHLEELVAARTAELSQALDTLSLTQEELVRRDKLAALGALVAGVAHELNTPIGNSLMVATTMAEHAHELEGSVADGLRRSTLDSYLARANEASEILVRNLQRAAALVASFKQLAVDSSAAQRRIFSLSELLADMAMPLRITAVGHRPITIELEIAPGLTMDSYPVPLAQVIGNIVDNCLVHAFAADAEGVIRISALRRARDLLAVAIADNGVGIAADLAARVYDPFFTTKLGSGGSGLGLHVAHNIVTGVLGGRIELHSTPGQGSTFTLLLPAVAPGFVTPA
jgi:signal transduction histidine kinase/PAS domain-containing protein